MLCSALLGYTTHAQVSLSVGVTLPLPTVEIHAASDFYEPLTPHGEWGVSEAYGRVWRPTRVGRDWQPYGNGSWQLTDVGWYWASEEPWGWATYHYGRWDYADQTGWYWVPQTQWAPAWVSWHEGGGYVGWAPLQPTVVITTSGFVGYNAAHVSPRAYVFVEHRHFLEPVRPATVVVNNTTIINKTVQITNTKIVNNTVINEGPASGAIAKASGKQVQAVPVHQLRHKDEAPVIAKPKNHSPTPPEKTAVPPVRTPIAPGDTKPTPAPIPSPVRPGEKKPIPAPVPTQPKTPVLVPAAPQPPIPGKKVHEIVPPKPAIKPAAPEPTKPGPSPEPRETPGNNGKPPAPPREGKPNLERPPATLEPTAPPPEKQGGKKPEHKDGKPKPKDP